MIGDGDLKQAVRRRGSFGGSLKAIAWSFFGVRKRSALEQDAARLNPLHLVAAALLLAALFVGALVAIVHWVVPAGAA